MTSLPALEDFVSPVPQLEYIAASRIAIELGQRGFERSRNLFGNKHTRTFPFRIIHYELMVKLGYDVSYEIEKLKLPVACLKTVLNVSKLVLTEFDIFLELFLDCFSPNCDDVFNHLDDVCFTVHATIDWRKTTKKFYNKNLLDNCGGLYMSIMTCCEQEINNLRSHLTVLAENMPNDDDNLLKEYWFSYLENSIPQFEQKLQNSYPEKSVYQALTDNSIDTSNEAAFLYFWNRLKIEEKENCLNEFTQKPRGSSYIVHFFMLQMKGKQQETFIHKHGDKLILNYMGATDYIGFNLHIFACEFIWHCFSLEEFLNVVVYIVTFNTKPSENFMYLWSSAPDRFKRYVFSNSEKLIDCLFDQGYLYTYPVIIKEARKEEKKKIVNSVKVMRYCAMWVYSRDIGRLDLFTELTLEPEDNIEPYIQTCKELLLRETVVPWEPFF